MPEVGKSLTQARVARGLTLEDCERDTRISKRYLDALEREDWRIFPAPVYSRAFMRTYAQYLGLDPQALMRAVREQEEPEIKPLPEIKGPSPTGSINWTLAAAVVVVLVVAGGILYIAGRGSEPLVEGPGAQVGASPVTEGLGGGERPALGRPVGEVQRGVVPDLAGVRVDDAIAALATAEIDYIIVETTVVEGTPGVVSSQSPPAGTGAGGDTAVTLVVPRGG
jgi:transcriptional regulator with XRE-family HTH domain